MHAYDLTHLADDAVICGFDALVARNNRTTAALLAHIAEIDARHLYLAAGCESMRAYCMRRLHLTEDAAAKRIQVARLARRLPALLVAIADGRLHLGTVRALASRLTPENVDTLIAGASHRTVEETEAFLAAQYPRAEALRLDDGITPLPPVEHATWHVPVPPLAVSQLVAVQPEPDPVERPQRVRTKVEPLSAGRYTMQVGIPTATHDKLRRAQELLGHAVPGGDVAEVLDRALDALIRQLEKRKFGLGARPRKASTSGSGRRIPAAVRRVVTEAAEGRCIATDQAGKRCGSRDRLEFDHVIPFSRGGTSTPDNLRLVCRAHNQHAAEQAFGRGYIDRRRGRETH